METASEQMYDNIRALIQAGTWEQLQHITANHPELASGVADALIADWIEENADDDPALIMALIRTRFVLARCRTVGIDAAFADFIANTPLADASGQHPVSLPIGVILRCVGDAYDSLPETLPAFKDAVEPLLTEADPDTHVLLCWCLGLCYHRLPFGDRVENLFTAICYITAFASGSLHGRQPFPLQVLSAALGDLVLAVGPNFLLEDQDGWLETLQDAATALPDDDRTGHSDITVLRALAYLQADADLRIQHIQKAVALLEEVVERSDRLGRPAHRARAQNLLGEALRVQALEGIAERLQRAIDLFEEVEAAYEAAELDDTSLEGFLFRVRVRTNLALALVQRVRGRRAEDQVIAVRLLYGNLLTLSANHISAGRQNIARHLSYAYGPENFKRAIAALRLALRYGSLDNSPQQRAEVHMECGRIYQSIPSGRNSERAIWHFEKALEVYPPQEHGESWAEVQVMLGAAYANRVLGSRSENIEAAVRCLRAALTIDDPARDYERNTARRLADVFFLENRWGEAHEAYQRAIDAGLFVLARARTLEAIRAEIDQLSHLCSRAALCLLRLGRHEDALLELENGRTRMLAGRLNTESALEHLSVEEKQQLTDARATLAEVTFERHTLFHGMPWRRSEAMLSAAYGTAARTMAELVRPAVVASAPRLTCEEILVLIPEGGALVGPLVTEAGSAVWIIPSGTEAITEHHVLPLSDETAHYLHVALVGGGEDHFGWLRAYFQRPPVIVAASELGVPQELWTDLLVHFSWHIWFALMGPISDGLAKLNLERGSPVILVGTSELSILPLAAACDRTEGARAFADDYALTVVPSLMALHVAWQNARRAADADPRLLAVVDPQDNLAYAALEGGMLSRQNENIPVTILPSVRATREEVMRVLPDYPIAHFACHAVFDPVNPLESCLVLAGGARITLRDLVADRPLARSRLVVLSACETAVTDVDYAPEESTGLSLGFIEAGAAAVVSTLWAVNDLSTMLLIEQFYERFLDDLPPALALREAQVWLRDVTASTLAAYFSEVRKRAANNAEYDSASSAWRRFAAMEPESQPFEHPYFWAAFVFSGASGPGHASAGQTQRVMS
jgi:CHAT domain-containing protein/tetratricopeptide (TPR) repeat protein